MNDLVEAAPKNLNTLVQVVPDLRRGGRGPVALPDLQLCVAGAAPFACLFLGKGFGKRRAGILADEAGQNPEQSPEIIVANQWGGFCSKSAYRLDPEHFCEVLLGSPFSP